MALSEKQRNILTVVVRANGDGSFCDLDQVIDRVNYRVSKESIQFSIRNLIRKGLIAKQPRERRRGRCRNILSATAQGYEMIKDYRETRSRPFVEAFK